MTTDTAQCSASVHDTDWAARKHGCRCPAALAARLKADKKYKLRRLQARRPLTVDAGPSRRMLQALAKVGFTTAKISPLADVPAPTLRNIRRGYVGKVGLRTAQGITRAYDLMYAEDGPSNRATTSLRRQANRLAWLGPEHWLGDSIVDPTAKPLHLVGSAAQVDDVLVHLALAGDGGPLSAVERRVAIRIATEQGQSARRIADVLGITPRSVQRIRGQIRAERQGPTLDSDGMDLDLTVHPIDLGAAA